MIRVKTRHNGDAWELDVLGVPYGGHNDGRDADDQFFDSSTKLHADKYGLPTATVYHSIKDDGSGLTENVEYVGKATSYEDKADGRWYRVMLDKLSPSAAKLWEAAKNGVLTVSSGTASHLARFNEATGHIKEWPVFELAMIHGGEGKSPANKFAIAIPRLKAMGIVCPQTTGDVSKDSVMGSACATGAAIKSEVQEKEVIMSDKDEVKETAPPIDMAAMKAMFKSVIDPIGERLTALENVPDAPIGHAVKADLSVVDEADRQPAYKSDGEFYKEVMKAGRGDGVAKRLLPLKSSFTGEGVVYQLPDVANNAIKAAQGINQAIPEDGGFLVGSQVESGVMQKTHGGGEVLSRVSQLTIGAKFNSTIINGVREDSRADGSRGGGVLGYWLAEAAALTKSKPAFRQIELKLKKVGALVYVTEEMMEDTTVLASVVNTSVPAELLWQKESAIFSGSGVGKPLGLLSSPARRVIPKESAQPATTIVAENILKMWMARWGSNHVWYANRDTMAQLIQLNLAVGTAGGSLVYMPPGGLSGAPYGTLLGAPVIEIEHASTLGTEGDLVLADMSYYTAISKGGTRRAENPYARFIEDENMFKFIERFDGQPTWDKPLTPANGTNALSPFVTLATRS